MSVVINRETRINNQGGQSQVVIGGAPTLFSLPYVTITYDTSVYNQVRPTFNSNIGIIEWGDGTITFPNDNFANYTYPSSGIYTAKFYSQQFSSQDIECILEDYAGGGNVINYDFTRANTVSILAVNSKIPSFTTGTTNTINYPNLRSFYFQSNTTFTYTAGMLGLYNPKLKNIDLTSCGFTANETNLCLVDMQTYCLNNTGSLLLGGTNAAPTSSPPNGLTAYTALRAAGWSVTTGSL